LVNNYYNYLRHMLKNSGLKLKKRLGQHFLADLDALKKIADAFDNSISDSVIEIGTGIGNLTILLAEKFKRVYTIELDRRFANLHKNIQRKFENIHFIYADAMRFPYDELIRLNCLERVSIGGNIPYSITSPLLYSLLKKRLPFKEIIFLVQEDVAKRINSEPGSKVYGVLSVTVQYYGEPKILFRIDKEKFFPPPKVSSALIKIKLKSEFPVNYEEEQIFFDIVNASFAQRRKQLANSIINSGKVQIDKSQLLKCLERANIDPKRRAETLSVTEFIRLLKEINKTI